MLGEDRDYDRDEDAEARQQQDDLWPKKDGTSKAVPFVDEEYTYMRLKSAGGGGGEDEQSWKK